MRLYFFKFVVKEKIRKNIKLNKKIINVSFWEAFYNLSERSISNIIVIWTMNAIPFLSIFAIGISGNSDVLVSWGLGVATINIILDNVDWGIMSGLDTLVSQAYGRKDIYSCEVYLNIWRYIILILAIPQFTIVYFSDSFFMILGQSEEISQVARYYSLLIFPGYVFMELYTANRRYFNWLGKTKETTVISLLTFIFNIILIYLLAILWDLGLTGVGLSSLISLTDQFLISLIYSYLQNKREYRALWIIPNLNVLNRVPTFLKYGIPGLFEWLLATFPIEILPIFAGWIGINQITVCVILSNIYFLVCHIPFSISLTAAAFVGNSLGENLPSKAITYVKTSILLTVIFTLPTLLWLFIFQDEIANSYSNNSEVIDLFKITLPLFILFNVSDFLFYTTEGILIGFGYQKILVLFIFIWMWLFMIPSTLWSIFIFRYGLIEMWIIFWIARALLTLSNLVIIFITNWVEAAEEASKVVVDES